MKKILIIMLVVCFKVFCGPNSCCCILFPEKLTKALRNQSGFKVINVTRRKTSIVKNEKINYLPGQILLKNTINEILDEISIKIQDVTEPTFIVFNEYFFSDSTLEYIDYKSIINQIMTFSSKNPVAIIYANFLYKMDEQIPEEAISFTDKYSQTIDIGTSAWVVTKASHTTSEITDTKKIFTNETSVFWNGRIISKYRKSTYCEEDDKLLNEGGWYYYGSGRDVVCKGLDGEYAEIANIINQYVYTDICWDIQQHIRKYTYEILQINLLTVADKVLVDICQKLQSILYHSSNDNLIKYFYWLKLLDEADSLFDFKSAILTETSQLKEKLYSINKIDTEKLIDFLSGINEVELSNEQFNEILRLLGYDILHGRDYQDLRKDINRLLELKNKLIEELNILQKKLIALEPKKENTDILGIIKSFDTRKIKSDLFSIRKAVLNSVFVHKDYFNPSSFTLHIIQSNSTDLNAVLLDFPENQIVVQSDPLSSSVFKITYSHFQHLIDKKNIKHYTDIGSLDVLKKNQHQMVETYKSIHEMFEVDNLINRQKQKIIIDILTIDV